MHWKTLLAPVSAAILTALPAAAHAQHAGHGMGGDMHGEAPAAPAATTATSGTGKALELSVTSDGFVPATLHVARGQRVRLVVTRRTERTCATEIVIKDLGIRQQLPLNQAVVVEFTPTRSGSLRYACGMDMISGVLVVD